MDWMSGMTTLTIPSLVIGALAVLGVVVAGQSSAPSAPSADQLRKMTARFAPVEIGTDAEAITTANKNDDVDGGQTMHTEGIIQPVIK